MFRAASRPILAGSVLAGMLMIGSSSVQAHAAPASQRPARAATHLSAWGVAPRLASPHMTRSNAGPNCPSNTTYSGNNAKYSCEEIAYDTNGHAVWIREGYDGGSSSGFGYLHFLYQHDLEISPVVVAIERSGSPSEQNNGNYQYVYGHKAPNGQIDQYIYVIEGRNGVGAPDGAEIGVITAYCQGPSHQYQQLCPSWVNSL